MAQRKLEKIHLLHNNINVMHILESFIKLDQVFMSRQSFQYLHLPPYVFNRYSCCHLQNEIHSMTKFLYYFFTKATCNFWAIIFNFNKSIKIQINVEKEKQINVHRYSKNTKHPSWHLSSVTGQYILPFPWI